jgi:enamidase
VAKNRDFARIDRPQARHRRGSSIDTLILNLGAIATGDLASPRADGDAIAIRGGRIDAIGTRTDFEAGSFELVIDANGTTATPGLIDPHVHPMIGDWNPRQAVLGWMEAAFHGGITSMLSQGVVHLQGRPRDASGTKAVAILTSKVYENFRPGGGLKLHSGAVILEKGLTESDFAEMAREGVLLVAEVGGSGIYEYDDVHEMLGWARALGMTIPMHFGAASIPGSVRIGADYVLKYKPDVVVHVNGGPISAPLDEITEVIDHTTAAIEVIHCGNIRSAVHATVRLRDKGAMSRLIIGSDSPVGHGAIPLAIIKTVVQVAPLAELAGEVAIAAATGNSARAYGLPDVGILAKGHAADVLLMDRASGSTARSALESIEIGDVPAITTILVDGRPIALRARNTPFTDRAPKFAGPAAASLRHPRTQEELLLPPIFS